MKTDIRYVHHRILFNDDRQTEHRVEIVFRDETGQEARGLLFPPIIQETDSPTEKAADAFLNVACAEVNRAMWNAALHPDGKSLMADAVKEAGSHGGLPQTRKEITSNAETK